MLQFHLVSLFWIALSRGDETSWQISVELIDATAAPSAAIEELRREVEAIYASASVRIHWLAEGEEGDLPEYACRIYILDRLPAMLETRLRTFRGMAPLAVSLGESESRTSQAIYVSRSAVVEATNSVELSPEALGTALGRVAAHELAHRFVSRAHTRSGLLREGFLAGDLTGSRKELRFTPEQATLLRRVAKPIGARSVRK